MKIENFEETFEATQGLSLENSFGTIKNEKGVKLDVSIGYRSEDNYGWFEFYDQATGGDKWYAEGGIWFDGNAIIDYDGVFSLPPFVYERFKAKGFDVSYVEE